MKKSERAPARSHGSTRVRASRGKKHWRAALARLEEVELVYARPSAEFVFKHALVQDTAYQSLLKNERRRLHGVIGDALEQAYGERAAEYADELVHHFFSAGKDAKTFHYARHAGDNAARVFAYAEAAAHFERALAALARLPATVEHRRCTVDVTADLVAASLRARGPEWCLEKLRAAQALMDLLPNEAQDRERMARLHFWMGDAYSHLNQQREAIAYLRQVLDAARDGLQDESLLAIPSNVIGRALAAQGKFSEAEPLLARAAPLLEESANWYEWILAVGFLGFARAAQGDIHAGLQETQRAFQRARVLGTLTGVGDSHIFTSFIYYQSGEYVRMLEHAEAALQAGVQLNDHLLIFLAHNVRAWAKTYFGQFQDAENDFARAHEVAERAGGQLFFADLFQAAYAELALCQGDLKEARARAEYAVKIARGAGSLFAEGLAQRVWAQSSDRANADEHFALSLRLFEQGSAKVEAARTRAAWEALG